MHALRLFLISLVAIGLLQACATTPSAKEQESAEAPPGTTPDPAVDAPFPEVTLAQDYGSLGELVRRVGQEIGGGLVLMRGLEAEAAPEINLRKAPYARLVETLLEGRPWAAQQNPHYYFIHASDPVYAPLLALNISEQLPPAYREVRASASYGGGTAVYNVLSSLGASLGITLIADNLISDAPCGELTLPEMPLGELLEAVFKSALLPPDAFSVETTEEYVFFQNTRRAAPGDLLLNRATLTQEQAQRLNQVVNVELPTRQGPPGFSRGAEELGDMLPQLSQQLGIPVKADPELHPFPVTWTVMNQVRVETALSLLIRQWPVDRFGFEMQAQGILIREK